MIIQYFRERTSRHQRLSTLNAIDHMTLPHCPRSRPVRVHTPHALSLALSLALVYPFGVTHAAAPIGGGQILQEVQPPSAPLPTLRPELIIEQPTINQAPPSAAFLVSHIDIAGNTLLPTAALHVLVKSGEGKSLTLADLNALAARITQYYREHGYLLAQAYIPAQTLNRGTVQIAVLEARYGAINLQNTSGVSDRPLKATLSPLQSGEPVIQDSLDRSLLLLADIPGVMVSSTLRPGAALGSSDLLVDITPGAPYSSSIGLDNAGSRYTGRARLSAGLNVNSPFHQGDLLTLNGLTSGKGLNYGRLGYQFLLDGQGTRLGAAVSALNYRLSNGLSNLGAHGTAEVETLQLSHPFIRSVDGNLYGQLEIDHKQLRDHVDVISTQTDRHTNALMATVAGDYRDSSGITNFNLSTALGNLTFDNVAAQAGDAAGSRTQGGYVKANFSLARLQQLSSSNALYVAVTGQMANNNLDSSEQFILGGPNSVRAYDVSAVAGAQGILVTLELRHNLTLPTPGLWQAIAFVDSGRVQVEKTVFVSGPNAATISGAGVGLSWFGLQGLSVTAGLAAPIGATPKLVGTTASARLWVQVQKGF